MPSGSFLSQSGVSLVVRFQSPGLVAGLAVSFVISATPIPLNAREIVQFTSYPAGTVVVKTKERRLYYVLDDGKAIRYPVGVGRTGMGWSGMVSIDGKYIRPAWSPPDMIKRENPKVPNVIPSGSPANPMGEAAMTLSGGGQYAIHGTNNPGSIGRFVSHGCIRMYNSDVTDLYNRVSLGTPVVVLR